MPLNSPRMLAARKIFIAFLFAYVVCVSFRLLEVPQWNSPYFKVDGEPLMATHDAYGWMAGANDTGRQAGRPMSQVLAAIHAVTGLNLGTINFWLPVLIAPLVVLPVCLIMARWKYTDFASLAGIVGGGSFGYLLRTRPGYGDTDTFTLLLPLLLGMGLLLWSHGLLRNPLQKDQDIPPDIRPEIFHLQAFAVGCFGWSYMWFYPNAYPIAMAMLLSFLAVSAVLVVPSQRLNLLYGTGLIICTGMFGYTGLFIGGLATALAFSRPHLVKTKKLGAVFLLMVLALTPFLGVQKPTGALQKVFSYGQRDAVVQDEQAPILPNVVQSIREAQQVDWDALVSRNANNWYVFVPALAGTVWLFVRHPVSLTFLPLLIISLMSFTMGNRFSMYGGVVLGMGLGALASGLLQRFGLDEIKRWLIQIALCLLIAWPIWDVVIDQPPRPVLPQIYAKSLEDMRRIAPQDAQLWQWWDYGYAAQYYAERKSFGDGGEHEGPHLYPLGVVHTTPSPLQASQMIKFVAASQLQQRRELMEAGMLADQDPPYYFPNNPIKPLMELPASKAQDFVDRLANVNLEWPADLPQQYLVFSWENLKLGYWISYFGSWDLSRGEGIHAVINRITGQANLNLESGILTFQDQTIPLNSMELINEQGYSQKKWERPGSAHVLANTFTQEIYLMDDMAHSSMMVRMLVGDPAQFQDHFELVLDRFPWVRAYRVK